MVSYSYICVGLSRLCCTYYSFVFDEKTRTNTPTRGICRPILDLRRCGGRDLIQRVFRVTDDSRTRTSLFYSLYMALYRYYDVYYSEECTVAGAAKPDDSTVRTERRMHINFGECIEYKGD